MTIRYLESSYLLETEDQGVRCMTNASARDPRAIPTPAPFAQAGG